ncbi:LacI family DNA-binding transcriptional regulator [Brachybacterium hainanense]|uniref:LacI family DNA-binding transcriptional regulator n=1 Tax=Brachybacterium hainanense TaxID=1541174 RepID=A0ABV6R6U5_9MICO
MPTTLKDVAALAGVSVATASRALQGVDRIGEATREKVRAAAAELQYTPNRTARALSTGRTGTLGLIVPDLLNPFFPAVVKGAQARARELGMQLLLADTDESPQAELPLVRTLAPQVDGVILCSSRLDEQDLDTAAGLARTVLVNREHGSLPSIVLDPGPGVAATLRHLRALGHLRIGYAGGPATSSADALRRTSLHETARELGLELRDLGSHTPDASGGAAAAEQVLLARPDAVLAYNDVMALGMIDRLRGFGLAVPADLSVVGWDDIEFAGMARPALSTIRVPRREAGCAAVDLLAALVRGDSVTSRRLGTELVLRASTARAHGSARAPGRSPVDVARPPAPTLVDASRLGVDAPPDRTDPQEQHTP